MRRAKEKALEVYPILFSERNGNDKTMEDRRISFEKGYEQAVNDALQKVKALQERYGAVVPKDTTQDCFKTARLIGYADMENYLNKLLEE